ncbi:HD domain-containing phosphohydrolase [Aromatoleum petrolei]|uniref:HD domain-containing phosphohydrolase n=1 Tax=Aromatoleum petrolei TaxID=76116 RepID=UPI001AEBBCD8|nr:HD domain-containing phosphohydrolase [Aromatoleum petrolei]
MNGSGYPRGLKGEEIALEARIVSVAEVAVHTISRGQTIALSTSCVNWQIWASSIGTVSKLCAKTSAKSQTCNSNSRIRFEFRSRQSAGCERGN